MSRYVNDLPENAPRWIQSVAGYTLTMCAGVETFVDGKPTGALPGGLLRNPRSQSANASGERLAAAAKRHKELRPYQELLSGGPILAGGLGDSAADSERGVAAALAATDAGASAMARLDREMRKQTGTVRRRQQQQQQQQSSKL